MTPRSASTCSTLFGSISATRSPGSSPRAANPAASAIAWSRVCCQVMVCHGPLSPSARSEYGGGSPKPSAWASSWSQSVRPSAALSRAARCRRTSSVTVHLRQIRQTANTVVTHVTMPPAPPQDGCSVSSPCTASAWPALHRDAARQLPDSLAHLGRRVAAQLLDLGPERLGVQQCPQRSEQRAIQCVCSNDKIVGLTGDRYEVKAEGARGSHDPQARVGAPGGDCGCDGQVSVLLACVAVDGIGADPLQAQLVVEEHAGACPSLAVDVADTGPGQILDAGQAERVAGRDDQSLIPVREPDDGDGALAEHAVEVGQRVLAGGRVQQVGAGQVTQPVAQRYQAPEGADIGGGEGDQRVGCAQMGGSEVEDEVMRADGDDGAGDLVEAAQELDVDLVTRVVAFQAGRHGQEPVGADQRAEQAGAARQRGGYHRAAHHPQAHPYPVIHAERGRELACQPRPGPRPPPGCGSLHIGEHRRGEDIEGQRGGHRIARGTENGRAVDHAQHHGVAGAHRDAVYRQGAELSHDPGGVVVAAGARACHDDQQIAAGHGGADGLGNASRVVRLDRQAVRFAAGLACLDGQHERVGIEDLPRAGLRADGPYLVAGGQHANPRAAPDEEIGGPGGGGGGEVDRAQPVTLRQQQLGCAHVLADRAHMLIRGHGRTQLRAAAAVVHVLAHDDRVAPVRHRVAGVDHVVGARIQVYGCRLAGAEGVGGEHGDAVHAGRVEGRRGTARPHGLGGDLARGGLKAHPYAGKSGRAAASLARAAPGVECAGCGNVADERAICHDLGQRYSVTSTSVPESSPVASSGTITYPSAAVRTESSADSPNNGVATPSRRRTWTTSRRPAADARSRCSRARTTGSAGGLVQPPMRRTNGIPIRRKTTRADRGLPGSPITGTPAQSASSVGFPGLIARPWHQMPGAPRRATAVAVPSRAPTEEPAEITMTSLLPSAARRAASSASGSSGTMPPWTGSPPDSLTSAARATADASRTWPGRNVAVAGGTTSSPVEKIVTSGRA